jgi:hypothetical protein
VNFEGGLERSCDHRAVRLVRARALKHQTKAGGCGGEILRALSRDWEVRFCLWLGVDEAKGRRGKKYRGRGRGGQGEGRERGQRRSASGGARGEPPGRRAVAGEVITSRGLQPVCYDFWSNDPLSDPVNKHTLSSSIPPRPSTPSTFPFLSPVPDINSSQKTSSPPDPQGDQRTAAPCERFCLTSTSCAGRPTR